MKFIQILLIIIWQTSRYYRIELKEKIKNKDKAIDGLELIQTFKDVHNPAAVENYLSKVLDVISIGRLMAVMFLFYPFLPNQFYIGYSRT